MECLNNTRVAPGAGGELARGSDPREVMDGHEGFCKTLSFSPSEERSDDMMSYQDLGAMSRISR